MPRALAVRLTLLLEVSLAESSPGAIPKSIPELQRLPALRMERRGGVAIALVGRDSHDLAVRRAEFSSIACRSPASLPDGERRRPETNDFRLFLVCVRSGNARDESTVVLLENILGPKAAIFRQIESVADLLADELLRRQTLAGFYNLQGYEILELAY